MHEVAIATALAETANHAATRHGLSHVRRMEIELGPTAGLSPESLGFALELIGRGTPIEGCQVLFSGAGARVAIEEIGEHEHTSEELEALSSAIRLTWIEGE